MPGSKKNVKNMWDFLNQPIGVNSLIDVLNKDIPFGSHEGDTQLPNLDEQTELLLDRAAKIAVKEGISIEESLARFGIDMGSGSSDDLEPETNEMRDSMLKSLDWEVVNPDQSDSEAITPSEEFEAREISLSEFEESFPGLESDTILDVLNSLESGNESFKNAVVFFGYCTNEEYSKAEKLSFSSGTSFWKALGVVGSSDIPLLSEVIKLAPSSPLFNEEEGLFFEWLIDQGFVSYRTFKQAQQEGRREAKSVCRQLSGDDYLGSKTFMESLSKFADIPIWDKQNPKVTKRLLGSLPSEYIDYFNLVPLKLSKTILEIGTPFSITPYLASQLKADTGKNIKIHLMDMKKFAPLHEAFVEKIERETKDSSVGSKTSERIYDIVASASAVNMVRQIFEGALESRATDIHLDPQEKGTRVRFRIDGMCNDVLMLDPELFGEVSSRIKILADLDITEKRRPQDGHINLTIRGQQLDMRIATVPTKFGEKIGIRLVYSGHVMMNISTLGFTQKDNNTIHEFIEKPHGMILATGPVGSGKTTTLYSCLNEIDKNKYNVMSIEDPVEYELENTNQVEVNYALQFGFVEGLRALLRQDPDTILIGEIRDEETARIAIRASMTGLLVFSTLHTNDAPGAVTTLYNFRLPTHLIANSLVGVIAQRLLRKICTNCKTHYKPKKIELDNLGFKPAEKAKIKKFYHGKGCAECYKSGYHGRVGIFEIMRVTQKLREAILEEKTEKELRMLAIKEGMKTLTFDARAKVLSGDTTTEEFMRILRI